MKEYDYNHLLDTITNLFPNASLEYDNDGQLIIYTGEYDSDEAFDPEHDWTRKSNE
jgi:hypothetical protein